MPTLPPTADTSTGPAPGAWEPDGPPPSPEALAAVAAIRQLLAGLDAPPDLIRRVTTWATLARTQEWVYVPAMPLPVATALAALGAGVRP